MSIEVHRVQRLRCAVESAGVANFAVDQTGTLSNFMNIPATEGSIEIKLMKDSLDPQIVQARRDNKAENVIGRRSCSISFSIILASTGTAASDNVAAVQGPVGRLLSAVMGGEDLGTGSVIATGTSASVFDVTAADGGGYTEGTAVGVGLSTGNEWRILDQVATDTLTLKLALSATPSVGNAVYSCASYYLTDLTTNTTKSLQFIVMGAEETDRWVLMGCQCTSMAIEMPMDGLPKLNFTFEGATWLHVAESAGNASLGEGNAIGAAVFTNFSPAAVVGGGFFQWTNGTTTYSSTTSRPGISSSTWESGIAYQRVLSPNGVQNTLQFIRVGSKPTIKGTFNIPYEDQTWMTHRDNKTDLGFVQQFGTAAGSTVLLEAPTCQVTDVQRIDDNGLAYQQVTWEGRCDGDTAANSADQSLSAFRIHLC